MVRKRPRTSRLRDAYREPGARIRLMQPTGGGGGVLEVKGTQVQLTLAQFELMRVLSQRREEADRALDPKIGFVPARELAETISLDSKKPTEDHVRHLVTRLRRRLANAGIADLIEAKYGVGYRLRRPQR